MILKTKKLSKKSSEEKDREEKREREIGKIR
jgi:hypothetical protein